jgi:hypothetical protein
LGDIGAQGITVFRWILMVWTGFVLLRKTLINTEINLWVPQKALNFVTSLATVSVSRKSLPLGAVCELFVNSVMYSFRSIFITLNSTKIVAK